MRKIILLWISVLFVAASSGGCAFNLFTDMSQKTSDAAIIDTVNNYINEGLWGDAVFEWYNLSTAGQAVVANQVLLATAYAGWGGLNIINLANNLGGSSEPTFFLMLMKAFNGATNADFENEVAAETIMLGISPQASGRTADQNMFMIFLELAKLGTLFASTADAAGNGVVAAGWNSCSGLTTLQAEHVATGLSILMDSMTYASSAAVTAAAGTISTQCSQAPLNATGLCGGLYDTSTVTVLERQAAQTLAGENNLQIGLEATVVPVGTCELLTPNGPSCYGNITGLCP